MRGAMVVEKVDMSELQKCNLYVQLQVVGRNDAEHELL
jgi:hypothetical protein